MDQMHSLLKRQLRRHFGDHFHIPKEWQGFIDTVNNAYMESDSDREMLERSLELSSQELLEANSEMRAIFLAIPDLLFRIDHEGRILNYKAGATTDLILHPKELVGKRIQDIPLKKVSEKFSEAIQQVKESKTIVNIEYSLSVQNQILFFEARLVPLPEDQIVVIIRNITERKRMEDALREAADKFRFVFENAYDGISIFEETPVREHRKLIDCNKRYAEMAGRSREDLLQIGTMKNIAKTLSEDNHESNMNNVVYSGSFSWIRPDGKDNVIEYTAVPIKVQGKTITIGIDRDITERKRAEEELRESEERYRRLVEVSPDTIAVHAQGRIVYVNPASVKLLRAHDESELIGKPVLDFVHPDYKELARQRVLAAMEQHTAQPMEEEKFICLDGTYVDVEVVSVPTTFKGMNAVQVIARDITERKQAEEALHKREEAQRFFSERLTRVLKTINELSKIESYDELCQRSVELAIEHLGFDRVGLCFLSEDRQTLLGVYGTDEIGHLRNEKHLKRSIKDVPTVQKLLRSQEYVLFFKEEVLYDDQRNQIGIGDHAVTRLWNGENIIGIYAVDNLVHQTPITDEDLKILDIYGTAMGHLFTLKRAEEELFNSRQMLLTVIDTIPQRVFWKDRNSVFVGCNKSLAQDCGYSDPTQLIGKTDYETAVAKTAELYRADDRRVIETGQPKLNYEEPQIRSDGSKGWLKTSKVPLRDKDGKVFGVLGTYEDITERKLAEKALQDSIERYKNLTEISPVGIFHTDEKGLTTYVNPKWCHIAGLSFENALGNGWLQAVHPDDKEKLFSGWQEATRLHKTSFSDYRFIRPDGTIAWVMGQATPDINSENQIVGYIGTITDITELKKAEESLQRERNLFRVLIDNLPDAIYVKDIECRKTIANVADVRNMGKQSEAEVLGKTDFDLYPADIAAGFYTDDLSVIQSGKSVLNKEEYFFNKDGKKSWLLTFKIPMRDDQGRIIGLVGIGREITEQKRAMEALTLLSHTVKSIGESISITDLKNNIIFVNEAFVKTYGYTEQELIGKSISIISCDPVTNEQMVLSETMKGGWQGELLNKKKDGTLFSISLSSSVVYDDKNQPIALVGVAADITERKQAEEALKESQALYRSFVDHLPASVFRKDSKGRYVFINSLFCQLKGLNVDEVLGKTPHELEAFVSAAKSTRPSLMNAVQRTLADQGESSHEMIMRTGKPIEMEEVFPQRDGTTKYFHVVKSPVFGSDGKIIGTQGVQFDITERKIAQEELQKERNLLRMVIDNLPDGIYTKDLNCRKTLTNRTDVYNMGRGSEAEVLGKDDYDLFPKEMADKFIADDRYVIQTGQSVIDREEYVVDAKGQKHFLLTTKLPFRDEQGHIIGLIGIGHDITEKKRAEEALQESNEKLRNIVEHSTNLFYSRNTDQVFTYLSPQVKDIFDCEPDEALVCFSNFMTDNSINKLGWELAEKAVRTGARQETYELELMSRKGRRVWVEIQEAPVVKDGKTISIVGAATDITERRWAEMALQVSEKKYRDIVTWAPIGIYQTTHSGKLLTANKGIVEMLGYENVSELIGCDMGKDIYYDKKDRERLIARHDTTGENITLTSETRWRTKNGSLIWVLMTVHDVRDKASEVLYYEGFVFDITERKYAEGLLRESEERYRLLVENSTDIVTEINAEDKYLYVSPNVKSILDFEPLDLVGTDVLSRVYGKDKSAIGEFLNNLGGSATYRYRDRSGGWHWFESSGRVYYTSSGEQRMVMVSRDITQRRKAEQQLEVSRKQLQHFTEHLEHVLEEERKRISRELHDELGQLLTILKFDLSWLKLEGSRNDATIIARIDAMMESVNEALASVKRISKEIRPPQLEALGLIGAIQWDVDQVEKKTGLKGIVTVEPAEVEIKGQVSTVLYRVFREALTNVLRHADATHVFIRLSQRLDSIFLIIRDDGRGITKKELKGTKSLGLVGIRERLRMVGGTFTIEGKTGSGTVLSVEVPLHKKENGESKS